ncbi:MAG: diguanylate cyclase [Alphaproteobacteria bacterium]
MTTMRGLRAFTFNQIGHRILAMVGACVGIGLVILVLFYTERQEKSILAQNQRTLAKVSESVIEGLRTVMEAGYANIGFALFDRLKSLGGAMELRILRVDGTEAFLDNTTVKAVNKRLGEDRFAPHKTELPSVRLIPEDMPEFRGALLGGGTISYYSTGADGNRTFTMLTPVANQRECHSCHGDDHPVRGVVMLTSSLAKVDYDIRRTWFQSLAVMALAVGFTLFSISRLVRFTVVHPIRRITEAMHVASRGDLTSEVPELGNDELAQIARSFNHMIRALLQMYSDLQHERNKLATVILGAQEGIIVTDRHGTIVLVNPAAQTLLGKSAEQVIEGGLLMVLDAPEWIAERRDRLATQTKAEMYTYREHHFNVLVGSIRNDKDEFIGTAVLIRDITAEIRLRLELQRQSDTDGLTGIYNRRYFNERLADEFNVGSRYSRPLSVFLFDVDHFKKFNDTYGHDQGDRVLKAIGAAMRETALPTQVVCRYGGEEFVSILPGYTSAEAAVAAETLRAYVEKMSVDGLSVTISIGVASTPPANVATPDELVKLADTAMYVAKEGGRNLVREWKPG